MLCDEKQVHNLLSFHFAGVVQICDALEPDRLVFVNMLSPCEKKAESCSSFSMT